MDTLHLLRNSIKLIICGTSLLCFGVSASCTLRSVYRILQADCTYVFVK